MKMYKLSEFQEVKVDEVEFENLKRKTSHFARNLELAEKFSKKENIPVEILQKMSWYGTSIYKIEDNWFVVENYGDTFCTSPHYLINKEILVIGSKEEEVVFALLENFDSRLKNIEDGLSGIRRGLSSI